MLSPWRLFWKKYKRARLLGISEYPIHRVYVKLTEQSEQPVGLLLVHLLVAVLSVEHVQGQEVVSATQNYTNKNTKNDTRIYKIIQ